MTKRSGGSNDDRFRPYYQKYYWRVVRFYTRVFHLSQEDAEDLAQEAFVRFYEAMDEYRGDAEWGFFETIARRVALNKIRSQQTQKRNARMVNIDDPEFAAKEPAAPQEPDYVERSEQARRQQQLRDAIRELPPGQREALQLWLAGLPFKEIAAALRTTVDAVKSRLRDARKTLRSRLGDDASLPEETE